MTKALFTGGRDNFACWRKLDLLREEHNITIAVHGKARGVDYDVDKWGEARGLDVRPYPVRQEDWDTYGKIAGKMRNALMLRLEMPDVVIAFPGGKGTRDMVERAVAANIPVIHVK